ncbi:hypothetical protein ACFL1R_13055 [Candidatus Latescibacterota bacterium]
MSEKIYIEKNAGSFSAGFTMLIIEKCTNLFLDCERLTASQVVIAISQSSKTIDIQSNTAWLLHLLFSRVMSQMSQMSRINMNDGKNWQG